MYYKRADCRYCHSKDLTLLLSLGDHPPSNSFVTKKQFLTEKKFPLRLFVCKNCFLVQLLDVVSSERIFNKYSYLSSTSKALVSHFEKFALNIEKKFKIKDSDLLVDIGCNDGILLDAYNIKSKKIGIEPSNVYQIAKKKGYKIYNDFFNKKIANKIQKQNGKAKIITATNVFAHIDDMHSIMDGINLLLKDDGIFIVEVSYLPDLIDQNLFDTIYHEHLCYLSLYPLKKFLSKFDFNIFNIKRNKVGASGPSITFFIKKKINKIKISKSVNNLINYEKKWGINKINKYKGFEKKIITNKIKTLKILKSIKESGEKIFCFGAPAKGNTLLNYYKLNNELIDFVSDNSKTKQGKFTPGSHIKIVSDDYIVKRGYRFALLLSWNYIDYFIKNSIFFKKGGKFIVPLPFPRVISK